MEQSASSETNPFSATQEIPHILWDPKVHHRIHNSLPPVPILSQINPVHTPLPCPEDPFWCTLLSTSGSSKWSPSLRFPHQAPVRTSPHPYTCQKPPPPTSFFLIWSPEQYMVRSTHHTAPRYVVFPLPCSLVPLRPNYLHQHPTLKYPQQSSLWEVTQFDATKAYRGGGGECPRVRASTTSYIGDWGGRGFSLNVLWRHNTPLVPKICS